ncbi:hypothetical protein P171DRAFT_521464 [Karstenula rhodostoma CBS 690.94]|uniref:Uncharacterized protein n=1 Tax=Karstenula rhodostoma CBS 690.94 TaxID=1392251 RepID=A0A9P4PFG5_9PLEO|nr:hypothetical protein P171DRAFT_521464 [Karstenula rhodostoma CBS 690.94]
MSFTNRRDKATALPAERDNGGSSPSPQRESSKASNRHIAKSSSARDSNSALASSGAVVKSFALSDLQALRGSNSVASSAQGAAGPSVADAHGEVTTPFDNEEEMTAGRVSFRLRSPSPVPEEPDSVDDSPAAESRKRSKRPVNDSRKRSKHSVAEHDELAPGSGEIGHMEEEETEDETEDESDEEKNLEDTANNVLPYRSIKTIDIPKRSNQDKATDAERRPQKDDPTTWYGTMSYRESLITYFCDEVGMSYEKTRNEGAVKECFEDGISTEWIRKCHVAALLKQLNAYDLKDPADTPIPTAAEARRGKKRAANKGKEKASSSTAAKNSTRAGQSKAAQGSIEAAQGSAQLSVKNVEPRFVREAPARQLEMTAIVVFKDLYKMSFDKIRDMLREDFDWVIDSDQVEHFYHLVRPSAYGSKGYRNAQDSLAPENVAENKLVETAAAGILVGISQGSARGGQQVDEKQAIEFPSTNNDKIHGGQVAIGTGVGNGAGPGTSAPRASSAREIEAGNALLQFRAQPVENGGVVTSPEADIEAAESEATIDMEYTYEDEDQTGTRGPAA